MPPCGKTCGRQSFTSPREVRHLISETGCTSAQAIEHVVLSRCRTPHRRLSKAHRSERAGGVLFDEFESLALPCGTKIILRFFRHGTGRASGWMMGEAMPTAPLELRSYRNGKRCRRFRAGGACKRRNGTNSSTTCRSPVAASHPRWSFASRKSRQACQRLKTKCG